MITVIVMIMLVIIPIQSIPTPHKGGTSNSGRLHGTQHVSHVPLNPSTGLILFNIKKI
jgi:hypothetical protein